jgi:hypothetical protein
VVVASLRGEDNQPDLRIGIAADEVIGTFTTAEAVLVDESPREVPHCSGMLPHEGKLALVIDLKKLTETFPVPVI